MQVIEVTAADISFIEPVQLQSRNTDSIAMGGESKDSYSIEVSGMGQLTGLGYTVSAFTTAKIKAKLQISALSSQDVKDLNALALGLLEASRQEEVREEEKTSASANLSLWGYFFGGGGGASYQKTRQAMVSKGLSDEQITKLMDAFLERAQKMNTVEVEFFVNNSANDFSVSGDLYLYTLSGSIQTSKGTQQYRMLADQASAGAPPAPPSGAPSTGNIIKL